jgi:hypothetical protein
VPAVLDRGDAVGIATSDAAGLWRAWSQGVQDAGDAVALAEHLETSLPVLAEAVAQVRKAAAEELDRRQDAWRPLARDLAA